MIVFIRLNKILMDILIFLLLVIFKNFIICNFRFWFKNIIMLFWKKFCVKYFIYVYFKRGILIIVRDVLKSFWIEGLYINKYLKWGNVMFIVMIF